MISERLLELREKNRMTQTELAEKLIAKGIPSSRNVVSRWERGQLPDARQFLAICEIYDVVDIRQTFLGDVRPIDIFAGLNYNGRREAQRFIGFMLESPLYTALEPPRRQRDFIPHYLLPASAGTGTFLDGDDHEMMAVDDTVPPEATFALRISGDSMMPRFLDGQTVFVKEQPTVEIGQIGIFILNNEGYCKKLGGASLISLNAAYPPIRLREYDELRTVGRVLC